MKSEDTPVAGAAAAPSRRRPPRDSLTSKLVRDLAQRHDPDAARAAMRLHLSNSRERLRQAFEQSP